MDIYRYLEKPWHAHAWTKGGEIPLFPSSTYRKMERESIYTPDENLTMKSTIDVNKIPGVSFNVEAGGSITNVGSIGGSGMPDFHLDELSHWDGLALCFSGRLDEDVAHRMKKKICIKVADIDALKSLIDKQLGVVSKAGWCEYTSGHQRDHFLKSDLDSWQVEYRIFWPINEKVTVKLPAGIGEVVATY
ncbi:hypothetical protein BK669_04305 [Pseudomonas fluorescens]|nr:hypothetical protein BK669_04305 [Pseudomonas fluorescens]